MAPQFNRGSIRWMEGISAWTGRRGTSLREVRLPTTNRFGRPSGEAAFLVEPEHEEEMRRFVGYANRYGRLFLVLVIGLSVVSVAAALLGPLWGGAIWVVNAAMLLLGLTIWIFPFSTPETTATVGLRASRRLARIGGAVVIAMAVGIAFLR